MTACVEFADACMCRSTSLLSEGLTDTGGMTREFFTLAARDIVGMYMCNGTFTHNSVALQVRNQRLTRTNT